MTRSRTRATPNRVATPDGRRATSPAGHDDGRAVATATGAADAPVISRRNLPLMLLQARERVVARFRPLLHAQGVTEQQWRVVRALLDAGPLEPREIVALCGFSGPSLAGVLARMQQLGLVQRAAIARDRRRQRVSLTPKARALAARLAPRVDAAYAAIEARAGATVMRQLCQALDAVVAALTAQPVEATDPGDRSAPRIRTTNPGDRPGPQP